MHAAEARLRGRHANGDVVMLDDDDEAEAAATLSSQDGARMGAGCMSLATAGSQAAC